MCMCMCVCGVISYQLFHLQRLWPDRVFNVPSSLSDPITPTGKQGPTSSRRTRPSNSHTSHVSPSPAEGKMGLDFGLSEEEKTFARQNFAGIVFVNRQIHASLLACLIRAHQKTLWLYAPLFSLSFLLLYLTRDKKAH